IRAKLPKIFDQNLTAVVWTQSLLEQAMVTIVRICNQFYQRVEHITNGKRSIELVVTSREVNVDGLPKFHDGVFPFTRADSFSKTPNCSLHAARKSSTCLSFTISAIELRRSNFTLIVSDGESGLQFSKSVNMYRDTSARLRFDWYIRKAGSERIVFKNLCASLRGIVGGAAPDERVNAPSKMDS